MAVPTDAEKLARADAATFAHTIVLRELIAVLYGTDRERRAAACEKLCGAIEAVYGAKLSDGGHEFLQRSVAEIESLFLDGYEPPARSG